MPPRDEKGATSCLIGVMQKILSLVDITIRDNYFLKMIVRDLKS